MSVLFRWSKPSFRSIGSMILAASTLSVPGFVAIASAQTKPANSSKVAAVRHCSECNASIECGAVCQHCSEKLTAQAKDGMVKVGPTKRMMATNDMSMSNGSFAYTLDNDAAHNGVSVYRRNSDGSLAPLIGSPFQTGGKGLTGGDIDEQGAIRSVGKFILAVNPGSDSIAVLEKTPRGLLHVEGSPFASQGSTPLSLAVHGSLVYVANQAAEFAQPKTDPNITGFHLSRDGKLSPIPDSTIPMPKGMGPAQVEFSRDGKLLMATAGFQSDGGEGSRIYSFRVMDDGRLKAGMDSPVKPEGSTGTVGFSISPNAEHLYVSAFKNSGVIHFAVDTKSAAIRQEGMPSSNDQRAACWTALTADGKTLYVGNFVSNSISAYDVDANGELTLLGSVPRRGATDKDTKDIALSNDGKFLYAIGSGKRQISIFRIESNRLLTELPQGQSPVMVETGQNITGLLVD